MTDSYLQKLLTNPDSRLMTEEELLKLYDEIQEVQKKNFWFNFKPRGIQRKIMHAFQDFDPDDPYQVVLAIGPNQIGKTFAVLHYLMDFLTRRGEYRNRPKHPLHFCYWTKHRRFQRATLDTALMKYSGDYITNGLEGRPGIDAQTGAFTHLKFKVDPDNGYYGDTLQFETYEMDYENIEGYVLDAAAMDEPHDHYNHFKYALQRIIEREGDMLCSQIPVEDTETEYYQKLLKGHYEDGLMKDGFISFATAGLEDYAEARCKKEDCDHTDQEKCKGWKKINAFKKIYSPEEFDRKIAGKVGKITDMVYPFSKNKHVIQPFEIPAHWRRDISIDYATSDNKWVKGAGTTKELKKSATVALFVAMPPPGEEVKLSDGRVLVGTPAEPLLFAYRQYYWTNEEKKRLAQDHGEAICALMEPGEKFQTILIDCAVDDTAFHEMKKVFNRYRQPHFRKIAQGAKTRFNTTKKKELAGHELVRQIIGNDQWYTFNTCEDLIREEENYKIDPNTQQPRTYGDHFMDARRYLIATPGLKWKDPAELHVFEESIAPVDYDYSYLSTACTVNNVLGRAAPNHNRDSI